MRSTLLALLPFLPTGVFPLAVRQEAPTAPPCALRALPQEGDDCRDLTAAFDLTVREFIALNPELTSCNLDPDSSYCVVAGEVEEAAETTTTGPFEFETSPTPTKVPGEEDGSGDGDDVPEAPQETIKAQANVVENCAQWYLVQPNDGCQNIVNMYGTFTLQEFYEWNPDVGSDCQYLPLYMHVCVGVPGTATPTDLPTPPSTSVPPPPTADEGEPTPQMGGVVDECTAFYLIEMGDKCYGIAFQFDVSEEDLLAWNAGIDQWCGNLKVGYYMCVGV